MLTTETRNIQWDRTFIDFPRCPRFNFNITAAWHLAGSEDSKCICTFSIGQQVDRGLTYIIHVDRIFFEDIIENTVVGVNHVEETLAPMINHHGRKWNEKIVGGEEFNMVTRGPVSFKL